ncbi:MAG TPA: hypothetical protein VJZ27_09315, partial [Aggregatilineales bacterium]|nr:hypothetical protein [Aggregatilineales bacterium]
MKNYRLLHIMMIVVLLGTPVMSAAPHAAAQNTCDPTAYIDGVLADVQTVDGLMKNTALTSAANAASSYLQVAEIRRGYEDMTLIPSCAAVLHSLMLQWFAAAQDEIALVLSIFADRRNTERYSQLRLENQERLNTLADAATSEINRLRSGDTSSGGSGQPTADWYRVYFTQVINSENSADHHGAFIEQSLIFVIDSARQTIDTALFEINAPDLTAALIRALGRGVRVRMVVDDEHALN